jgi:hypothetical protein
MPTGGDRYPSSRPSCRARVTAEGEVGVGQLDPGLNSQVGHGVGQQGPQSLRADKLLPCRFGSSPVQVYAGPDRADQGRCETLFYPGGAHDLARLDGERLGPVPLATRHRQQRSFTPCDGTNLGYASLLSDADRIVEVGVAAVRVTGQDARAPAGAG